MDYRIIIFVVIIGILLISYIIKKAKNAKERSLEQERLIERINNERLTQELKHQKEDIEIERYSRLIENGELNSAPNYLSAYVRNALERKLDIRKRTEASKNRIERCMGICFRCRRDICLEEKYNEKRT